MFIPSSLMLLRKNQGSERLRNLFSITQQVMFYLLSTSPVVFVKTQLHGISQTVQIPAAVSKSGTVPQGLE